MFVYDLLPGSFRGDDAFNKYSNHWDKAVYNRKIYFDGKAGLSFIDTFNDESLIRPALEAALSYQVDTVTLAKLSFTRNTVTNLIALTFR